MIKYQNLTLSTQNYKFSRQKNSFRLKIKAHFSICSTFYASLIMLVEM